VDVWAEPLGFGMGAIADRVAGAPDSPLLEDGHKFVLTDTDSDGLPVKRVFQFPPHLLTHLGAVSAERSRCLVDSPVDDGVLLQPGQPPVGYEVIQFLVGRSTPTESSPQFDVELLSGSGQRRSVRRWKAQVLPGTCIAILPDNAGLACAVRGVFQLFGSRHVSATRLTVDCPKTVRAYRACVGLGEVLSYVWYLAAAQSIGYVLEEPCQPIH
jgi:hypothetical protein